SGPANNDVPVAARLVTLTDHPGLDLVVVFVREGDGAGGNRAWSGLVTEIPRFHDTLRNTRAKRGADGRGSAIGAGALTVDRTLAAGCARLYSQNHCRRGRYLAMHTAPEAQTQLLRPGGVSCRAASSATCRCPPEDCRRPVLPLRPL